MVTAVPCANCGATCPGRGPFCGPYCKALAEFVRVCRRWLREPAKQADPEYAYVLQVRLAFLHTEYLGHGRVYDEKARRLSAAQKAAVWERDNGLCVKCGKPGAEVDHIADSSDNPANLQLLCLDCHHEKTRESISVIADTADLALLGALHAELIGRIDAPNPTVACDNEQTWGKAWRHWPETPAHATAYERQETALRFADIRDLISTARN